MPKFSNKKTVNTDFISIYGDWLRGEDSNLRPLGYEKALYDTYNPSFSLNSIIFRDILFFVKPDISSTYSEFWEK